jgi:hypothetical protein
MYRKTLIFKDDPVRAKSDDELLLKTLKGRASPGKKFFQHEDLLDETSKQISEELGNRNKRRYHKVKLMIFTSSMGIK